MSTIANFFDFVDGRLIIGNPDIFLTKEFGALLQPARNKCKEDTRGTKSLRAFKELAYIALIYGWKSQYSEQPEEDRELSTLEDLAILPGPPFSKSPELEAAIDKYLELQDTRSLKLLQSAYKTVDKLTEYFEDFDSTKTDDMGKPINTAKDAIANIASLGKLLDGLEQLELRVKKEKQKTKDIRADAQEGLFDGRR